VSYYLPKDVWYDFWTGERVVSVGEVKTVDGVGWGDIPVHIKGGSIIPMRARSANTTAELRKQHFAITIAPGADGSAKGELYLDEGESLDVGDRKSVISFTWDGHTLVASGVFGYDTDLVVESIVVLGEGEARLHEGAWRLSDSFEFRL
jgi:alpha-glucosidase